MSSVDVLTFEVREIGKERKSFREYIHPRVNIHEKEEKEKVKNLPVTSGWIAPA
jgi:hypothetical protein